MSIKLAEIFDYARAQAIADALHPTEESNWRAICRSYSKTFSTPLHEVLKMQPEEVALAFFESQVDERDVEKDLDQLMDTIYLIEDPNYEREKRAEIKDFIKQAEAEEEARLASKKPIHPGMKLESEVSLKNTFEAQPGFVEPKPTGGSIDLSYLADNENEG